MTDSTLPGDKYHWRNIFSTMLELVEAYQRHEVSLTSLLDLLAIFAQPGDTPWSSRFSSELAELTDAWLVLEVENEMALENGLEPPTFGQKLTHDAAVFEVKRILRRILAYPDDVS